MSGDAPVELIGRQQTRSGADIESDPPTGPPMPPNTRASTVKQTMPIIANRGLRCHGTRPDPWVGSVSAASCVVALTHHPSPR